MIVQIKWACVGCFRRRNPDRRLAEFPAGIPVDRVCVYCLTTTRSGLVSPC